MDIKQIREKYADPDNPRPGDEYRPPLPKDLRNASTPAQEQDNGEQPKDPLSPTEAQGQGQIPHHTETPATDPVKPGDGLPADYPGQAPEGGTKPGRPPEEELEPTKAVPTEAVPAEEK